jgi:hypothetical protein
MPESQIIQLFHAYGASNGVEYYWANTYEVSDKIKEKLDNLAGKALNINLLE